MSRPRILNTHRHTHAEKHWAAVGLISSANPQPTLRFDPGPLLYDTSTIHLDKRATVSKRKLDTVYTTGKIFEATLHLFKKKINELFSYCLKYWIQFQYILCICFYFDKNKQLSVKNITQFFIFTSIIFYFHQ